MKHIKVTRWEYVCRIWCLYHTLKNLFNNVTYLLHYKNDFFEFTRGRKFPHATAKNVIKILDFPRYYTWWFISHMRF